MYIDEPRHRPTIKPLPQMILEVMHRNVPLGMLVLLQHKSHTISDLSRILNIPRSMAHKYLHRLIEGGFVAYGGCRPIPPQVFLRHHKTEPLIAEVIGMQTRNVSEGLELSLVYHDGSIHTMHTTIAQAAPMSFVLSDVLQTTGAARQSLAKLSGLPDELGTFYQSTSR